MTNYQNAPAVELKKKPRHIDPVKEMNDKSRKAIEVLRTPQVTEWAKDNTLPSILEAIRPIIRTEAQELKAALKRNYNVEMPEPLAELWIADQLRKGVRDETDRMAVSAMSKDCYRINVCRTVGVRQQNGNGRFPNLPKARLQEKD